MTYQYGPFSLNIEPRYNDRNIDLIDDETETQCSKVMILSHGKALPSASIVFDTANDKNIVFHLDDSFLGEMMEISLFDIMLQHEKPKTNIMIICTRQIDMHVFKKEKRRINFNLQEHHLCMFCIRGNEQITIESKKHDTKSEIICRVKFIVSHSK